MKLKFFFGAVCLCASICMEAQTVANAYKGFAKQTYTMLDNLKLGYGGTKDEMKRLLDDASALSGQKESSAKSLGLWLLLGIRYSPIFSEQTWAG